MFIKEDIIISKDNFINKKCDMINYDENIEALFVLADKIIKDLKIVSLSKIKIKNINFFDNEAGKVTFIFNSGEMASEIELSRKTFAQFNNPQNTVLKNEALATIYHEFYHIYDRENIIYKINTLLLSQDDLLYYKIGIKYWSEFFAYYKTCNLHISDYPFRQFNSLYQKMKQYKPNEDIIYEFFYFVSNIIAYILNGKYLNKLDESIELNIFHKDKGFISLSNELNKILYDYPNNIATNVFINLGKLYCNLLKHFSYEILIKDNKMIISQTTNIFENYIRII